MCSAFHQDSQKGISTLDILVAIGILSVTLMAFTSLKAKSKTSSVRLNASGEILEIAADFKGLMAEKLSKDVGAQCGQMNFKEFLKGEALTGEGEGALSLFIPTRQLGTKSNILNKCKNPKFKRDTGRGFFCLRAQKSSQAKTGSFLASSNAIVLVDAQLVNLKNRRNVSCPVFWDPREIHNGMMVQYTFTWTTNRGSDPAVRRFHNGRFMATKLTP